MVGHGRSGTVHFWSLAVEEQFYLVWPVAVGLLGLWKRQTAYVSVLLAVVVLCPILRVFFISNNLGESIADRILSPRSILVFADSLAVGCLGAWMVRKIPRSWDWTAAHSTAQVSCLAVLLGGHLAVTLETGAVVQGLVPAAQAWAVLGCLCLGAHRKSLGYRILNSRALVTTGVLSYSLYVWHFLFLAHYTSQGLEAHRLYDWKYWLVPAVLASAASYYCLERPLLALRARLRA